MMGANYQRVIPRDLFNEADLLKCLGRLYLLTEYRPSVRLLHSGSAFNIMQNESDGSIYCGNFCVIIGNHVFDHFRPLNSREPWPLWLRLRSDPDAEDFRAFDDDGAMSDELRELLG